MQIDSIHMYTGPFQIKNLRWLILGLLFMETILNYVDLQTLSVLAPTITRELNMNDGDYARVTMAFQIAYMIMFLLGGWILDKVGIRWGMVLAIGWWSTAEILHGFARNAQDLMICRFLFGFGYPGAYLAAAKVVSEWYPSRERGFATGTYTAGATVGATLAPVVIAWISLSFGWRFAFIGAGIAGFIYLIIWLLVYRPPEKHAWIGETERAYILAGRVEPEDSREPTDRQAMRRIFRSRHFWAVALGRMIGDNPWIFYVLWIPMFLDRQYGLSLKEIGFLGWIPFLFADFGCFGGGWVSGWLIKRGVPVIKARLTLMLVAASVTTLTFTLGLVSSTGLVIALLSLMMFFTMTWIVNQGTIPVDIFPKAMVGRVVGLTATAAIFGNILFSYVIGYCFDRRSYMPLFILMSVVAPIAYVIVRTIIGDRIEASGDSESPGQPSVSQFTEGIGDKDSRNRAALTRSAR